MIPKQVPRQRDFSAGQIDASAKRRDDQPAMRAGARQASNKRILASGGLDQRPGRQMLFEGLRRTDEVKVGGELFRLCFSANRIVVRDADAASVLNIGSRIWDATSVKDIVVVPLDNDVVLFHPDMQPYVLTRDPDTGAWSSTNFAFRVTNGGQKRCPFYRLSPKGITMQPSAGAAPAASGTIGNMTNPSNVFDSNAATFATRLASTDCYVGEQYVAPVPVRGVTVTVTAPTAGDGGEIILQLYGKSSIAPVSSEDGTLLGSASYAVDTGGATHEIGSIDNLTEWDFVWVRMVYDSPATLGISEVALNIISGGVDGSIDVEFSDDVLVADHVGTRMRYQGRQITIDTVIDAQHATATVNEKLLGGVRVRFAETALDFAVGDVVEGQDSGCKGTVTAVSVETISGTSYGYIDVLLFTDIGVTITTTTGIDFTASGSQQTVSGTFTDGELIEGPIFSSTCDVIEPLASSPATDQWDEEVFNDMRGWPESGFVDQRRLGFCAVPAIPGGISWSAIDVPDDHYPSANPQDAIFEIVPSKDPVLHVVAGDDEFVFTEKGVYYIPISETNPLKPGSVAFRPIVATAAASVRPVLTPQGVVYVSAGLSQLLAIVATGQVTKPYLARDVSELHTELFTGPIALASASGGGQFPEQYLYVLNSDGTVVVGRYDPSRQWAGYVPWSGEGHVVWVSARQATVLFVTRYSPGGTNVFLTEQLDADAWLDGQILINDAPTALAPTGGDGPLWMFASGTVQLMDGLRYLGERDVDADGNLVLENADDFSAATVVAGQKWSETLEPFIPHAAEGGSRKQTLRRRKMGKIAVSVQRSIGFVCAGRRIPAWNAGDDEGAAPALKEQTYFFKQMGRTLDPSISIIKDIPGPLRIVEFSAEVGI